jgi:hypothetical protein
MPDPARAQRVVSAASVVMIAVGLVWSYSGPSSIDSRASLGMFIERVLACMTFACVAALLPTWLALRALRRSVPVGARWVAAAAGAASASLGGLVLHLCCPIADAPHVGISHGGAVVVVAALSALLGARAVRPRVPPKAK